MRLRVTCAALVLAAAPVAAALASPSAAGAAVLHAADRPGDDTAPSAARPGKPLEPAACSGEVCLRAYYIAGSSFGISILVRVWDPGTSFIGHFELQLDDALGVATLNSRDAGHPPGSAGVLFLVENNPGRYTATAWRITGPGQWQKVGSVGYSGPFGNWP